MAADRRLARSKCRGAWLLLPLLLAQRAECSAATGYPHPKGYTVLPMGQIDCEAVGYAFIEDSAHCKSVAEQEHGISFNEMPAGFHGGVYGCMIQMDISPHSVLFSLGGNRASPQPGKASVCIGTPTTTWTATTGSFPTTGTDTSISPTMTRTSATISETQTETAAAVASTPSPSPMTISTTTKQSHAGAPPTEAVDNPAWTGSYTIADVGAGCASMSLQDITSEAQCFAYADAMGLQSSSLHESAGFIPIYGCMYFAPSPRVVFSLGGPRTLSQALQDYRSICDGTTTTSTSVTAVGANAVVAPGQASTGGTTEAFAGTTWTVLVAVLAGALLSGLCALGAVAAWGCRAMRRQRLEEDESHLKVPAVEEGGPFRL